MNIPEYCDLNCSPDWYHGNINRYQAEERLYNCARNLGIYADRLFLVREKHKGLAIVVSIYKYQTNSFQHHLFEKFKGYYLVNYNFSIYETNLDKLINDLCTYSEIGFKINSENIPLCNKYCIYRKKSNSISIV